MPSRPLLLALAGLLSCGPATEPGLPSKELRVLFVGNSLTYVNDLPTMVGQVALADGETLHLKAVAFPNYSLEDHWAQGAAAAEIVTEDWDVVVMQQGPSSLEESRINLDTWALKFDSLADAHHTCLAFYMVWPDATNKAAFGAIYDHYKEAADTTGGQFLPAGRAWVLAWRHISTLPFYGKDGFHPSVLGTYAAALVIAGGLTGHDPVNNTAAISGVSVSGAGLAAIKVAARDALAGIPRRCGN